MRQRRYPPLRIAVAVRTLMEDGLEAQALLKGTDLSPADLDDADVRVSSLQLTTVARNAVALGVDSGAGLRVGMRFRATCYGMIGYALLCSTSMRHAFDLATRYHRLGNGLLDAEWTETADSAFWTVPCFDELRIPNLDAALYRFVVDMTAAAFLTVFKDVMGPWCYPSLARFTGPPPEHVDALAKAFGCPLEFDQPANEVHYPAAWLERAPQLANPITAAEASKACARMLEEFRWQAGFTRRVYNELTCTPGRFPNIEEIASALCMTSRTLRRRLEDEGTSYSALLDDVRKALAED